MKTQNFNHTVRACFMGSVIQAIVINFAPLLFVTFHNTYGIGLDKISFLITIIFSIQLLVDASSPLFVKRIGYRATAILTQAFSAAGMIALAVLPGICPNPYVGLLIATALYAIGAGLGEVVISPIVEYCPTKRKAATMCLLHSFYCWGQMFAVLASTLFFVIFGIENWHYLALIWAILPIANAVVFCIVPMPDVHEEDGAGIGVKKLFSQKRFWILALVMLCGGAAELCISQWASAFAQTGLGVEKTVGDLMGPCLFAALMGTARLLYAKFSDRVRMSTVMIASGILCVASYLLAALSPIPALGLVGCALAGFSVGVFWPCALNLGASGIGGGVTMFAMLALFGDMGCTLGPTLVGLVSDRAGGELSVGLLTAVAFPILLIFGMMLYGRGRKQTEK